MAAAAPTKKSVLWVAADTGGVAVLSMLAMLVIARFIRPDQFGIAALATGSVLVVNLYVEGLFHDVLIQRPDVDDTQFRAAFWAVILTGSGIFLATAIAAVLLNGSRFAFFLQLLACTAAALPFSGIIGVSTAKLRRGFQYDIVAVPSVTSKVIAAALGLTLAWLGWGAWSLVIQYVAAVILQAGMLMVRQKWRPAFTLDFRPLRSTLSFALPYAAMHTVVGLRMQAFAFMVAGTLGLSSAGYLNVALRLTQTPQIMLQTALVNLGLPTLARQQSDSAGLAAAYDQFNRLVAAVMCPLFLGLAFAAPSIVPTILGARWLPSVVPMRLFAVFAAIYLVRLPSAILLRSMGWVKYSVMNALFQIGLTMGGLLLFRPKNLFEAAFWWAAPLVVVIPVTWMVVSKRTGVSIPQQVRGYGPAIFASACMGLGVLVISWMMNNMAPPLVMIASVTGGALIYLTVLMLVDGQLRRMAAHLIGHGQPTPMAIRDVE
jgi:O-antigen/teichoic acid export membrane protein